MIAHDSRLIDTIKALLTCRKEFDLEATPKHLSDFRPLLLPIMNVPVESKVTPSFSIEALLKKETESESRHPSNSPDQLQRFHSEHCTTSTTSWSSLSPASSLCFPYRPWVPAPRGDPGRPSRSPNSNGEYVNHLLKQFRKGA